MRSTATFVPRSRHTYEGVGPPSSVVCGGSPVVSYRGEIKQLRDSWVKELGGIKSLHSTVNEKRRAEKLQVKKKKKELDDFMKNYLRM